MDENRGVEHPVRGMVRQGDVLLVPVDDVIEAPFVPPAADAEIVLATGERTGHAHVVRGQARTTSTATMRYLVVEGPATLVHDEHAPIPLAPGAYEVRRQREWTPEEAWQSSTREFPWVSD